jgi:glycosyltransferase involved in cell wall biosynthesis
VDIKISNSIDTQDSTQEIKFPYIDLLPEMTHRPRWSVMITAYKRTTYLAEAIKSVLAQGFDQAEMQIEVIDDASPNKAEINAIVQEVGQGRVSFYSSPSNNGIYENWNVCIRRVCGYWVHILSDDDIVLPGFYEEYQQLIATHSCSMVVGQSIYIDDKSQYFAISEPLQPHAGLLENALKVLAKSNRIHTPAIIVSRDAYEKIGGFTSSLLFTPDWEMWTRLAARFQLGYINKPYSCFRLHPTSETRRLMLSGESIVDCFNASQIIKARLSNPVERQEVEQFLSHWLFQESLSLSQNQAQHGFFRSALIHIGWAFKLSPSLISFKSIFPILLSIPIFYLKNRIRFLLQSFSFKTIF